MPITTLTHRGKSILYTDYRGCQNDAEMLSLFHEAVEGILKANQRVRTLNNFEGVSVSSEFMETARKVGLTYKHLLIAKAILGSTGIKKIFINTYSIFTGVKARAFEDQAAAMDYLASCDD
ncbi:MAG: hypothetical protein J0L75_03600 [Spirochaetes bacterium]|nr:hypothetical protein [Spirochaetota bacterium]